MLNLHKNVVTPHLNRLEAVQMNGRNVVSMRNKKKLTSNTPSYLMLCSLAETGLMRGHKLHFDVVLVSNIITN